MNRLPCVTDQVSVFAGTDAICTAERLEKADAIRLATTWTSWRTEFHGRGFRLRGGKAKRPTKSIQLLPADDPHPGLVGQSNVEWLRSGSGALKRLLGHHVIQPTESETVEIVRCQTAKFQIPVVLPVPLEEHRIEVKWRLKPGNCWNELPLFLHCTDPVLELLVIRL